MNMVNVSMLAHYIKIVNMVNVSMLAHYVKMVNIGSC